MATGVRLSKGKKVRPVVPRIALILGYGGVVPFAATAMLVAFTWPSDIAKDALDAQLIYGAIILSFLGGVRWGATMTEYGDMASRPPEAMGPALTRSILPSAAGWVCLLAPPTGALISLSLIFFAQYLSDLSAAKEGKVTQWYWSLRTPLTFLAVGSLLVSLVTLLALDLITQMATSN